MRRCGRSTPTFLGPKNKPVRWNQSNAEFKQQVANTQFFFKCYLKTFGESIFMSENNVIQKYPSVALKEAELCFFYSSLLSEKYKIEHFMTFCHSLSLNKRRGRAPYRPHTHTHTHTCRAREALCWTDIGHQIKEETASARGRGQHRDRNRNQFARLPTLLCRTFYLYLLTLLILEVKDPWGGHFRVEVAQRLVLIKRRIPWKTLFTDIMRAYRAYRVNHHLANLGWVDLGWLRLDVPPILTSCQTVIGADSHLSTQWNR